MRRFTLMARLGLAEPLVRLARSVEASNRRAAQRQADPAPQPALTLTPRRSP
jgi:hypothetical protein